MSLNAEQREAINRAAANLTMARTASTYGEHQDALREAQRWVGAAIGRHDETQCDECKRFGYNANPNATRRPGVEYGHFAQVTIMCGAVWWVPLDTYGRPL